MVGIGDVMANHGMADKNASSKTVVDVSKLYNSAATKIDLEFPLDASEVSGEFDFKENPVAKVCVYRKAEGISGAQSLVALKIELKGEYSAMCARCTKSVTKNLCVNAEYGVAKHLSDESDEYVEASDGLLDVGELARTLFLLDLPQRVLCKDECLGLCSVCGTDLNVSTCSCKTVRHGNGLEGLKKLLDKTQD